MGRGTRNSQKSDAISRPRPRKITRPLQDWDTEDLDQATLTETNRLKLRELKRELWRRPRGSGFELGQKIGPLTVEAIDPDRLRIVVRLERGGLKSMTQTQLIDLLSDGRVPYPTEPDERTPPTPVDYGQHAPAPPLVHPSHVPVEGHSESGKFVAERKRLDAQRGHMSEIRQETDIVEFERLYWHQGVEELALAREVASAGGLDQTTGHWGSKYTHGLPAYLEFEEQRLRDVYEHIKEMRERGEGDEAIIAYLERVYDSPFGGPRPESAS